MNVTSPALATLLSLALSGCAVAPASKPPPRTHDSSFQISLEACDVLARAEADVASARTLFALWTTARDALLDAREAATRGDSQAVIRYGIEASSQARLGIEQLDYPSTER